MKTKRCSINRCSTGVIGLIVEHTKERVHYLDGSQDYAYAGYAIQDITIEGFSGYEGKLIPIKKGEFWYFKNPEFITEVYIDVEKPINEQVEDACKVLA
jgi:hypothetical protein